MVLDSGASLTIPANSLAGASITPAAPAASVTGIGGAEVRNFGVAEKLKVGPVLIRRIGVMLPGAPGLANQGATMPGLIGWDLMLRFDAVELNFAQGYVAFNPVAIPASMRCAAMRLAIDSNGLVAGMTSTVALEGQAVEARIDTGANVDLLVHGRAILEKAKFVPVPGVFLYDAGGTASPLTTASVQVALAGAQSIHNVYRTENPHPDFAVTLGAKFFAGQRVLFDFKERRFCLGPATTGD